MYVMCRLIHRDIVVYSAQVASLRHINAMNRYFAPHRLENPLAFPYFRTSTTGDCVLAIQFSDLTVVIFTSLEVSIVIPVSSRRTPDIQPGFAQLENWDVLYGAES